MSNAVDLAFACMFGMLALLAFAMAGFVPTLLIIHVGGAGALIGIPVGLIFACLGVILLGTAHEALAWVL